MTTSDTRKLVFTGLLSLGLIALNQGCSSSSNPSDGGGDTRTGGTGGRGGTAGGAGGADGGAAGAGGGAAGSGGVAGGCTTANTMALTATQTSIDNFAVAGNAGVMVPGMGSIIAFGGGTTPAPTVAETGGTMSIMLTTVAEAGGFPGVKIGFNDCLNAATPAAFTGVSFTVSGTVTGAGCVANFQIQDTEHTAPTDDPKGMTTGGYSGSVAVTVTATPTPVMVTFASVPFMNNAANPGVAVDATKLLGVAFTFPTVTANACTFNLTIDNLAFF
jgi:hypothetical protein